MATNKCGKTRDVNQPYEVWVRGSWEWRVLKKWQIPEREAENEFARWFCAVRTPYTHPGYDLGDTYVKDIINHAHLVYKELEGGVGTAKEGYVLEEW